MLARELANLTLSESEMEACRPIHGEGGHVLRAFCPFHQSDKQRSLRVAVDSGRFSCYACGAWGYTEEKRVERRQERFRMEIRPGCGLKSRDQATSGPDLGSRSKEAGRGVRRAPMAPRPVAILPHRAPQPIGEELAELVERYRTALPGSIGERYLRWRGIPLEIAQAMCVGYAADGEWAHRDPQTGRPVRQWKHGRLVIPHTDPEGRVVNLYGRAIGTDAVPKALRHDHLAGPKGYFNASDLVGGDEPVYVCEGPFDALSLLAAGVSRATAIFGVAGWRWEWAREARRLVFAFDADQAGSRWRELAWEAVMRGKEVAFVPPEALGGCKDVNEAWGKGVLGVGKPGEA